MRRMRRIIMNDIENNENNEKKKNITEWLTIHMTEELLIQYLQEACDRRLGSAAPKIQKIHVNVDVAHGRYFDLECVRKWDVDSI